MIWFIIAGIIVMGVLILKWFFSDEGWDDDPKYPFGNDEF
jgi:hypothetical protein